MRLIKAVGALGLVGLAAVNSPVAVAADDNWYLGGSIGQSREKNSHSRIGSQLSGSGLTTNSIDDDSQDLGYKLFGGKKFNKNFAVEGGYFNLGKFGFTAHTTPAGTFAGTIKLSGFNVDAVGILPLTDKFSAFGRVGLQYAQAKDTFTASGGVPASFNSSPSKSAANYKVGAGVQYDFTPSLGLRGEWERYRINDAVGNKGDIDLYLVGLVYTFGRAEKPAPRAEPAYVAPVAVAAAPAPEPVLVIVPVLTQQYCSILDIQFEINKNTVQRETEERIDKGGIFMTKYANTTAVIEGTHR